MILPFTTETETVEQFLKILDPSRPLLERQQWHLTHAQNKTQTNTLAVVWRNRREGVTSRRRKHNTPKKKN